MGEVNLELARGGLRHRALCRQSLEARQPGDIVKHRAAVVESVQGINLTLIFTLPAVGQAGWLRHLRPVTPPVYQIILQLRHHHRKDAARTAVARGG